MNDFSNRNMKETILDSTFAFLVKTGLENVKMRDLCKETGISSSSIYHWFENKEDLICSSTVYGVKKIADIIFGYCFDNISSLNLFFETCISKVDAYRPALRLIYQVAASPVYEERFKKVDDRLCYITNAYAERMSTVLNAEIDLLRPIVYLFMAAIVDYAIWGDKRKAQVQIDYISGIVSSLTEQNKL